MNRDDFVYSHVSKFGINDGDWRYLTQSAALKFEMDKKGNVSSIYKGLYVYRDRDSEENILPGETWIVSLTLNPKTESNYFAKGIMRIDARFLFDLEKDQMDEIADASGTTAGRRSRRASPRGSRPRRANSSRKRSPRGPLHTRARSMRPTPRCRPSRTR
ncbi:hypothetical protein AUQ37_02845 [Candidatus Methanomethylophilus sp. 1R26]|uniref:hypothetical protein n=1 Tax=Candidatus Methanomethylophilus sp. 1R26 TaxID=1769296 RepID=UPI0007361A48|nr:hypothetical protein [Candidatus Methanomethylophilus sp. 1R26]KUE73209.1 hypothetical protein AUQ37_02845 [Candidatus Methanomethylophilus sp. 1R26]